MFPFNNLVVFYFISKLIFAKCTYFCFDYIKIFIQFILYGSNILCGNIINCLRSLVACTAAGPEVLGSSQVRVEPSLIIDLFCFNFQWLPGARKLAVSNPHAS